MANRNRDSRDGRGSAPSEGAGAPSAGVIRIATLIGVGVLVAMNVKMMTDTGKATKTLSDINARIDNVNNRVVALGNEVRNTRAPAPQRGPDPAKVYTVRTEGAPAKGPATAPITIAEFSEFQ